MRNIMKTNLGRRKFNGMVAGAAALAASQLPAPAAAGLPNIIMILADDLGWGDLGCYGHPTIRTPNLDRMALEGMRFTQCYSAAPVCTPSRVALLTGRLPIRSGLTRVLSPRATGGLQDTEITLAQALKPAGYATACVGKWHLGRQKQYLPLHHGFDRYFGLPYSNDMSPKSNPRADFRDLPPTPLIRGDDQIEEEPDQTQLTRRYTEEAIRFIRDSKLDAKPFFLYMPHTFPHTPLAASDRFRGKSPRGLYGDVVEELDWSVGEVLRTVKQEGLDDNTLVFFSSDNGPWLIQRENGGSAGLLRDGKATTWEGGMREPFIARWPGKIKAGVVTHSFASLMDVFPTCMRVAGLKMPHDRVYDGADLAPVLFQNGPGREALMWYYNTDFLHAVRKGPWKLHIASNATFPTQPVTPHDPPLLYNIERDPSEKYDVADANPAIVKELLGMIVEHKRSMKPGPPQR